MKIQFFNAADIEKNIKCTIHKTGKLGFSEAAAKKLNIEENRYIKLGKTEEDDGNLYMIAQKEDDIACFKANKTGKYFYLTTKALFDSLNVNYTDNLIIYDMTEIEDESYNNLFLLKRRDKKRK